MFDYAGAYRFSIFSRSSRVGVKPRFWLRPLALERSLNVWRCLTLAFTDTAAH